MAQRLFELTAKVLLVVASLPLAAVAQEAAPVDSGAREEVQVRMVQVDVSVIDPKGDSFRSVSGLTAEQFEIRLDGEALTETQRAELKLDRICEEEAPAWSEESDGQPPLGLRPMLAVIDFNYLDARGRHRVADAIDALAEAPGKRNEVYKIYGLTQQLREMTDGFTRNPATLRAVAERVRRTAWTERPAEGMRVDATERGPESDRLDQAARDVAGLGPQVPSFSLDELVAEGAAFGRMGGSEAMQIEANAQTSGVFENISRYDAIASVSALEAVMRAHTFIPGRKIVLLFSTEAFRIPDETKMRKNIDGIREIARRGFAIWTVEVEGVTAEVGGQRRTRRSELISALAQDTGGATVRNTGRLHQAFTGAREQMGCYYLFSLPVAADPDRTTRMTLSVKLDTDAYPDLWGLRVVAPTQITVPDRQRELESQRISALLSPDDFDTPPVDVTMDYPVKVDGRQILPIRLRVPLGELSWSQRKPGGPATASVLVDAVAERTTDRGRNAFCSIGSDKVGTLELELPSPPDGTEAALAVELPCPLDEWGLLTARGVITDLARDAAGAGRSTVFAGAARDALEEWQVVEPRIEAASGRDFWWYPGADAAIRDRARRAWRPVSEHGREAGTVDPRDRIALSYVLCGPDRTALSDRIGHSLTRQRPDGSREIFQAFGDGALDLGSSDEEAADPQTNDGGPFCAAARLTVPEYTLMPGRYAFVVHGADAAAEEITGGASTSEKEQDEPGEAQDNVFTRLGFEVR